MAVDDSYTESLLHMDGADASTTFTDESGKTVTANGNVQIDTAQSKFGGASGLFDGTGDYLSLSDSADWYFATGDFTIDFWVRFNSLANNQAFYNQYVDGNNEARLFWVTTNLLVFQNYTGGVATIDVQKSWTPSTGTWYHVALVRSGNDFKFFIDGTQIGTTVTDSSEVTNFSAGIEIGRSDAGASNLNGWLDEFRISKGIARWTANFTPPTSPYGLSSNFFMFFD